MLFVFVVVLVCLASVVSTDKFELNLPKASDLRDVSVEEKTLHSILEHMVFMVAETNSGFQKKSLQDLNKNETTAFNLRSKKLNTINTEIDTGYFVRKVRANSDCSGNTLFSVGRKLSGCSGPPVRKVWCIPQEDSVMVQRNYAQNNDGLCNSREDFPYPSIKEFPNCHYNAKLARGSFSMTQPKCIEREDAYLDSPGLQVQYYNDNTAGCEGAPSLWAHLHAGACIPTVIDGSLHNGHDDDDDAMFVETLTRLENDDGDDDDDDDNNVGRPIFDGKAERSAGQMITDFAYLKYSDCNQNDGSMMVTQFTDALCLKPVNKRRVVMSSFAHLLNQCYQNYGTLRCIPPKDQN
jgi:hypothetical protein